MPQGVTTKDMRLITHADPNALPSIFLNDNVWISIKISLRFVAKGPADNMSALVQKMARWKGGKPLSDPTLAYVAYAYMRHSASMSLGAIDISKGYM